MMNKNNSSSFFLSLLCLALISLLLSACGSSKKIRESSPQRKGTLVGQRFIPAPVLRIGLVDKSASVITVKSTSALSLIDASRGTPYSTDKPLYQISFFRKGSSGSPPQTFYRVQIASFKNKSSAQSLAAKIRKQLKLSVTIPFSSQTGTYRVHVGEAKSRSAAANVQKSLAAAGYKESFIATDNASGAAKQAVLVAVDAGGKHLAQASRFHCVPRRTNDFLSVTNVRYRGAIEIRVDKKGLILPINVVNLEDYLRGVVPAEMSSSVYPQLEALKAQALAARTYAVKNRGQYAAEGFDLCNTAACQVYRGVGIEQKMTDQAIQETAGETIVFNGEPINALFTSTCGGHTEDVENIFKGDAPPYLRGVYCAPEAESFKRLTSDSDPTVTYGADGLPIDFEIALLKLYKILPSGFIVQPSSPVHFQLSGDLIERTLLKLGKKKMLRVTAPRSVPTLIQVIDFFVTHTGWRERIEKQISQLDLSTLLDPQSVSSLSVTSQKNLLYFLRLGFVSVDPDGSLPIDKPINQTILFRMLIKIISYETGFYRTEGLLVARDSAGISLQVNKKIQTFSVGNKVKLFKKFENYVLPMRTLQIAPGDNVLVILDGSQVGALVHTPPLEGVTSDRFSRFLHWDIKYSQQELDEKVKRYAAVGEVRELKPLKYGVSERVVELEVIGSTSSTVLTGLRIRWALGLRENLFIIDRLYDGSGAATGWRFIGRGWGHGVGLCQVGAYGMAIAGKSYREIIKHYYSGVEIRKF